MSIDDKKVRTLDDRLTDVETPKPGDTVVFNIKCDGERTDVSVRLEQAR